MVGWTPTRTAGCGRSCEARTSSCWWSRTAWRARAAEGTPLAPLFDGLDGTAAICWGGEDIVSLAKEITRLAEDKEFAPFEARGGVMDGERLDADRSRQVSKWPSREEQLSILVGQILSPGANLVSQLNSASAAPWPARSSKRAKKAKKAASEENAAQDEPATDG